MSEPSITPAYVAIVDIDDRRSFGSNALGDRFFVGILGGQFEGPRLRGRVLAGGADRQWLRPDGVKELDALYEMQTHDGCIITVRNRVIIDDQAEGGRYARSVVQLQAADARYDWLNRRIFVGTLESLQPQKKAVKISVFELT